MNYKQLGLMRDLLTAVSDALVAYGLGTSGIWEEVTGSIVVLPETGSYMVKWVQKRN